MPALSAAEADRNDFILDNCAHMDVEQLSQELWRRFKIEASSSAINSILYRARRAQDPRVLRRRDRRGGRGSSPFKFKLCGTPARKSTSTAQPGMTLAADTPLVDLPSTARLLFEANPPRGLQRFCKYPLHGTGIGLIVCGSPDVTDKESYCPACREVSILKVG
jgi:hypothetical protein